MAEKGAAKKFRESMRGVPVHTGDAETRFTRTPVEFWRASGVPPDEAQGEYRPTVNYQTGKGRILITTNPYVTDYGKVSNALQHEDIHAALEGVPSSDLQKVSHSFYPGPIDEFLGLFPGNSDPWSAWSRSGRAGHMSEELPAYIGANDPAEFDIGPRYGRKYMNLLYNTIPPQNAATIKKIVASGE